MTLDDIEHVHFEGVQFSAKNVDMVVILKEEAVPKGHDGFITVSAIPMSQLDGVKTWLNDIVDKVRCCGVVVVCVVCCVVFCFCCCVACYLMPRVAADLHRRRQRVELEASAAGDCARPVLLL